MTAVASGRWSGGHPDVPRWAATTARKKVIGLLLTLVALGVIALFSIAVGSRYIPPDEVLQVLLHPDDSQASTIVHSLRVPRTAIGIAIGMALGVAGAVMQALTRNPLADPGLLGVNAGAAVAVVIGIGTFGVGSALGYLPFAFAGALQPDLIIGINQALTQEQYEQFSKIAPTLARPAEYNDFGVPPQVQAEMIGQALGQSDEIAAQGADVADQVAQAAADNPAFAGKTVSVVWPNQDGSWFAWSTTDPRVQLMESLGLVLAPEIAALGTDAFFHTVSAENTEQIDADVIVVLDVNGVKSTVEANPVFNSLDAVKNGQVAWVTDPNVIGALSYSSVLSLPYAIDAIVPALAETIGGAAVSTSGAVVTTS